MTHWINEQISQTKDLIHAWRINRLVNVLAEVDHAEIAPSHLVLGLNIGWENKTGKPIAVTEIQVILYKRNEVDVLVHLLPLERFQRVLNQRVFERTPLSQFLLRPNEIHTEHIRFISHESYDIPVGVYTMEIQVRDTNHQSYTRRIKIEVESKMKYRVSDDWDQTTHER